jgi:hypothetical protein
VKLYVLEVGVTLLTHALLVDAIARRRWSEP